MRLVLIGSEGVPKAQNNAVTPNRTIDRCAHELNNGNKGNSLISIRPNVHCRPHAFIRGCPPSNLGYLQLKHRLQCLLRQCLYELADTGHECIG